MSKADQVVGETRLGVASRGIQGVPGCGGLWRAGLCLVSSVLQSRGISALLRVFPTLLVLAGCEGKKTNHLTPQLDCDVKLWKYQFLF